MLVVRQAARLLGRISEGARERWNMERKAAHAAAITSLFAPVFVGHLLNLHSFNVLFPAVVGNVQLFCFFHLRFVYDQTIQTNINYI